MKITQLDIEGFRSLKKVSWKPGDLNVVIGPNGSGKSNLLRMLEMISVASQGRLSKQVQSEGGIGAIAWDGEAEEINFTLHTTPLEVAYAQHALSYNVSIHRLGSSTGYQIDEERFGGPFVLSDNTVEGPFWHIERQGSRSQIFDDNKKAMTIPQADIPSEETLLSLAAGPFTGNTSIPVFQKQMSNWSIYQNFRVDSASLIRQASVIRNEQRVIKDGQNLTNVLYTLYTTNRNFKQDVNDAMNAAFGDDFDELIFPPVAEQRIELQVRWRTLQRPQSAANLSDGTLRFLFLLTVLASPNPPSLIAIDEPETGLHPSMLPIIAEFAIDAARRTQVIFTTHSDQFLDAFRDTKPTTTVAKWTDGETSLHTISGTSLDYWLEGYSLGSLFRSGELEDME